MIDKMENYYELSTEQTKILANHIYNDGFNNLGELTGSIPVSVLQDIANKVTEIYESMKSSDYELSISISFEECPQCRKEYDEPCCKECTLFNMKTEAFYGDFANLHPCYNCNRFQVSCLGIDSEVVNDIEINDDELEDIDSLYDKLSEKYYIIVNTLKDIGINKINPRIEREIIKQIDYYEGKPYDIQDIIEDTSPHNVLGVIDKIRRQIVNELERGTDIFADVDEENTDVYKLEETAYGYSILKNGTRIADIVNSSSGDILYVYTTTDDLLPVREKIEFENYEIVYRGNKVGYLS